MPEKETFECLVINHRKNPVTVHEQDGMPLVALRPKRVVVDSDGTKKEYPGDEFVLETHDPLATFARYSSVVFLPVPPWAQCTIRPGWIEPKRKYPCTFELIQGATDPEYRTLLDGTVCLMHGVPVIVDLPLLDEYIQFDRVVCGQGKLERLPHPNHDGIAYQRMVREDVKHLRPVNELERIKDALESLARPVNDVEHVD